MKIRNCFAKNVNSSDYIKMIIKVFSCGGGGGGGGMRRVWKV